MRDWHYIVIRDKETVAKLLDIIPKGISDEDMEQLLQEEGMELLDMDCSIRLGENDAKITRISVTTAFAKDHPGSPAKMEETLKTRLGKRYELSDGQIQVSVRQ